MLWDRALFMSNIISESWHFFISYPGWKVGQLMVKHIFFKERYKYFGLYRNRLLSFCALGQLSCELHLRLKWLTPINCSQGCVVTKNGFRLIIKSLKTMSLALEEDFIKDLNVDVVFCLLFLPWSTLKPHQFILL